MHEKSREGPIERSREVNLSRDRERRKMRNLVSEMGE